MPEHIGHMLSLDSIAIGSEHAPRRPLHMKWILPAGAAAVVAIVLIVIFSGFGDVPCQDGVWDTFRQTCIPT